MSGCLLLWAGSATATLPDGAKKRITVEDTIRMTTLPETLYAGSDASTSRYAGFSPDGKRFVVVTEKGLPETNENEFSILLFETREAFGGPKPKRLLSMRSRSNRDAIKNLKWVRDGTLLFIGENRDGSQVYSLNIATGKLRRWTNHPTAIVDFDIDKHQSVMVYAAEPGPRDSRQAEDKIAHGYALGLEALQDVPRSKSDFLEPDAVAGEEVFVKRPGAKAVRVSLKDRYFPFGRIAMSPDGRSAVFGVLLRDVPPSWIQYDDSYVQTEVQAYRGKGSISWLLEYRLLNTRTNRVEPLLDAPVSWTAKGVSWCDAGQNIVVSGTFLPLDVDNPEERELRKKKSFAVKLNTATRAFEKITDEDLAVTQCDENSGRIHFRPVNARNSSSLHVSFRKTENVWLRTGNEVPESDSRPAIILEQGLNVPPKLFASDATTGRKSLLLDLNPQFSEFVFGKVEAVTWKSTDGREIEGGLYLPPDYAPGQRYPLVIQTHAFSKDEFWINGPWNSGFAAQPLAAHDIVVLQVGHEIPASEHMKHHRSPEEAPREMAAFEGAIDYLDQRGIIDREMVGIIGFSRTQYHVAYTLTHSTYHFAAATLVDGLDGGYLQYLGDPHTEKEGTLVNGGPPFGSSGFAKWLEHSPSFSIERVTSPVRLECHSWQVLACWEWYSMLTHMGKPVELIYLPDAPHILVKPWERITSQQGDVDWFCFWLKGEANNDPEKREQYERWREMRLAQQAQRNVDSGR
jgi:dipeptidyl aminopeptidase/acylaminoacyl peptidase